MSTNLLAVSCIELLEPRLAPAGTVLLTTAGGVLTIVGDAAPNGIVITDTPLSGNWTISDALSGTTFILNGSIQFAPFTISAQNSIKATLGDSNDRIEIMPAAASSGMMLSGVLNVNMGKGDDIVIIGGTAAEFLSVTGATGIDLGEGTDTLTFSASTLFTGTADIKAGLGTDTVSFINGGTAEHTFLKGLKLDMGAGQDTLAIESNLFNVSGGAFAVIGAGLAGFTQNYTFNPDIGYVQTAASFSIAAGEVELTIGSSGSQVSQFGASLTVTTGTGSDTVILAGTISVTGAVTIDMKAGDNELTLDSSGASLQAAALTLKAGADNDTVTLGASSLLTVNGAFSTHLGSGANVFEAAGDELNAGSLSYSAGATGNDTVSFTGDTLRVIGRATLALGAGTNDTAFNVATSVYIGGNLIINGLSGNDDVTLNSPSTVILGSFNLNLGHGNNTVEDTSEEFVIGGALSYTGGTGNDRFESSATSLFIKSSVTFKAGGNTGLLGSDLLYLRPENGTVGSVKYTGATGADYLQLGNTDASSTLRLTVIGGVAATMAAGNSTASVIDTAIYGVLTVQSSGSAAHNDLITINESTLNGAVTLNLGASTSLTTIDDSMFRGAFLANLGAGADMILIDSTAGTTGLSSWYGAVQINAGSGMDDITLGSNPPDFNAGNSFYSKVVVDGGADADNFSQGNNTFVIPLITSNV
jgi:hypothetical protein